MVQVRSAIIALLWICVTPHEGPLDIATAFIGLFPFVHTLYTLEGSAPLYKYIYDKAASTCIRWLVTVMRQKKSEPLSVTLGLVRLA